MKRAVLTVLVLGIFYGASSARDAETRELHPTIQAFLGDDYGSRNDAAPEELEQFGRLIGVWDVDAEMRRQDGGWAQSAPGVWAWKYDLGGFVVRDLWFQGADNLPTYMSHLGRDYLLTSNRVFDPGKKRWHVAWVANGAGQVMGADYGTFSARLEDDEIVMTSSPGGGFGLQRVVFYEIGHESFRWKSEYSQDDGQTWHTVMRLHAKPRPR